jgi:hypothetical protein
MNRPLRIGQIVPNSNTTLETEIPAMLRAREAIRPQRFTFHSSRMRMPKVTKEELDAMKPNFARVAEAMDAKGIRIEEPGDVREELTEAPCVQGRTSRRGCCRGSACARAPVARSVPHDEGLYAERSRAGIERQNGRRDPND